MRRRQGKRVAFLSRYDRSRASSRVRVYDYVPYLQRMGWECRILPFPSSLSTVTMLTYLVRAFRLAQWADVMVLQKLVLREAFVDMLLRVNSQLVFDFDDAVYVPPVALDGDAEVRARYRVLEQRLQHVLGTVRAVIAGSRVLARYAERATRSVHVIPSSVDLNRYPLRAPASTRTGVVFGWIGSPENLIDFTAVWSGLRRGFRRLNGVATFKVVSTRAPELEGVSIDFEPWRLDRDADFLHGFDVGLMPLGDTERSRGRCAFKAIQYMAVGLPVLATPVGSAPEVVVHGETGLMASSEDEWVQNMLRLAADPQLRRRLGAQGRARVERLYSIQANTPRLATVLLDVAGP